MTIVRLAHIARIFRQTSSQISSQITRRIRIAERPARALFLTMLCAASVLASGVANAQRQAAPERPPAQREVPPSRGALQYSFAPIVRRATPAVVNVYVRSTAQVVQSPMFNDPLFREFFGQQFGNRRENVQNSLGSGVIVDPSGLIVTNAHVIRNSGGQADIRVVLADLREFKASVVLDDRPNR